MVCIVLIFSTLFSFSPAKVKAKRSFKHSTNCFHSCFSFRFKKKKSFNLPFNLRSTASNPHYVNVFEGEKEFGVCEELRRKTFLDHDC